MEYKITNETPRTRSSKNARSMEKLRESVIRLARSHNSPLSHSQIDDQLRSLFASSPPLRTPIHPPYSEMIIAAIGELNERGGSNEGSISRVIESKYDDLPFAHPRLLSHHLEKLAERGEIDCNAKRYGLPKLPKLSRNPNSVKMLEQQSKKGRKRSRRRDGDENGELELVVGDEVIASPEPHSTPMYRNEGVEDFDGQCKKSRSETECVDANVPIIGAAGDDGCGSSQMKLANVNEEEHSESVCEDGTCALSPDSELMPATEIAPLQIDVDEHIASFPPLEQHNVQGTAPRSMPWIGDGNAYVQERLMKDQVMTSVANAKALFSQLQRMFVMETLQKRANNQIRMMPTTEKCGERNFVAKEPTRVLIGEDHGCVMSPQLNLQNLNKNNEPLDQGRSKKICELEQEDRMATSKDVDDNASAILPQLQNEVLQEPCGEPELAEELQTTVCEGIDNGYNVSPQLQSISMVEMEYSPQQKKKNETLRRVKSMARQVQQRHGEQEMTQKDQMTALVIHQPTSEMQDQLEQLQFPTMQYESPSQKQHGEKKNKGRRGRPRKNYNPGDDHEPQESLVEVQKITAIGEEHNEEQQMVVRQKRKGCRGRPRKRPYFEQEEEQRLVLKDYIITAKRIGDSFDNVLMVSPIISSPTKAVSLHRRGRLKKMKPEFELRVARLSKSNPLRKKNNGRGRGRPRKNEPEFALQPEVDPWLKKKNGRGRPKKKKPDFEEEGEKQVVALQDESMVISVDENGVTYPPLIGPKLKRGPGRPRKNIDSVEFLQEELLLRRRPGRPLGKRKEVKASNSDVHNEENRLESMKEAIGGSLVTENNVTPLMQETMDCEMAVKKPMADPPTRKVSKAALKRLQQPQLPMRQLRPRLPPSEKPELNQHQPLRNSETS